MRGILCQAAVVLTLPAFLHAATYVVDGNHGDDAGAGTVDAPWRTISRGVEEAEAGDTILVRTGVYRESVLFRRSGKPGKPITLKAAANQRVVLTGADRITGWLPCSSADTAGNPNHKELFMVDLDGKPQRLFEGEQEMVCARTPDTGWWSITKGLSLSEFTDTQNLTQTARTAWEGWTVAILEQAGGSIQHIKVAEFDPATHKITLAEPYSRYRKTINEERDRYFMENHLSALDGPGQYVIQEKPDGCRLFVWPRRLDDQGAPVIEAPQRSGLITYTGISHLVIDGLEICFSTGTGIGSSMGKPNQGVVVQNCYIHHNHGYGIQKRQSRDFVVRRNVITHNSHGVVMGKAQDALVEENDVGFNRVDGVIAAGNCRHVTIRRNYIHDHFLWGHPDNLQFWNDVQDLTIRDNVLVNAGQTMMSEGLKNVEIVNNLWLGSRAVSMIVESQGARIHRNSVVAVATPTNWQGQEFSVHNNVFAPLRDILCYGVPHRESFRSDYNLLWNGLDAKMPLVVLARWKDSYRNINAIQTGLGQEAHGFVAKPQFQNAASQFTTTHYARISECSAERLVLREPNQGRIAPGDHVELNFDGVPRRVTQTGPDWIEFRPPLPEPPINGVSIANWGQQTDFAWDLRLADGCPGKELAQNDIVIGCDLDLQAYKRGDFDGDGKRDIPLTP